MRKKLIAAIMAAMLTVAMAVPVMAGPVEEVNAARAQAEQRYADYLTYQANLAAFQKSEIAKGEAQRAAGKQAEQENFARIAAFQKSEIAKGEAMRAAGKQAEQENFARIAAFQNEQKAKEAAREAIKKDMQKNIDLYLSLF